MHGGLQARGHGAAAPVQALLPRRMHRPMLPTEGLSAALLPTMQHVVVKEIVWLAFGGGRSFDRLAVECVAGVSGVRG